LAKLARRARLGMGTGVKCATKNSEGRGMTNCNPVNFFDGIKKYLFRVGWQA